MGNPAVDHKSSCLAHSQSSSRGEKRLPKLPFSFSKMYFNECLCLDKNSYSCLSALSVTWANYTSQLLLCNVSKGMFSGQLDMFCVLVFPASLLCLSAEFPAASKLIKIRVSRRQGKESLCLLHLLDQLISLQEKHPALKMLFIALKFLCFKHRCSCVED